MSEITTAEHYLLMKLFEAESEAEAAKERLGEIESAYTNIAALIRQECPHDLLVQRVDQDWHRLYTPDEVEA